MVVSTIEQLFVPNTWSGGVLNGPFVQPPPFYYPSNMAGAEAFSITERRNQVPRVSAEDFPNRRGFHARAAATPRRGGILRQTGHHQQRKTPTKRRLVHFMPEPWQQPDHEGIRPVQRNPIYGGRVQSTSDGSDSEQSRTMIRSKKSPAKAHRNTLSRRLRRQRLRAAYDRPNQETPGQLSNNRFNLLSEETETDTDDNDDSSEVHEGMPTMKTEGKEKAKTTDVPNRSEHVERKKKEKKQKKKRLDPRSTFGSDPSDTEEEISVVSENENSRTNRWNRKVKAYLQDYKILSYLKNRVEQEKQQKRQLRHEVDFKEFLDVMYIYAKETVEMYDTWVYNEYETQVWRHFSDLGRKKNHWAKEIVDITHTREAARNIQLCEEKIARATAACFEANSLITRKKTECFSGLETQIATVVEKRVHDMILDYIKDATQGLSKMSINRMRRASIEKDEWDALQAFEKVASEQQKTYAKIYCKPTIKNYHKKKKNFDVVAAHISNDIIPKILPHYDFHLPVDATSLTSEQARRYKESIQKLSKDFRLKATTLYLEIAKQEYEFQETKLTQLLADFPSDRVQAVPQTQEVAATPREDDQFRKNDDGSKEDNDDGSDTEDRHQVFTQRAHMTNNNDMSHMSASAMYEKYVEVALKRTMLEIERAVHFLVESGVQETPVENKEARNSTPILRKDFMLQM